MGYPHDSRHDALQRWWGGTFDPMSFDITRPTGLFVVGSLMGAERLSLHHTDRQGVIALRICSCINLFFLFKDDLYKSQRSEAALPCAIRTTTDSRGPYRSSLIANC